MTEPNVDIRATFRPDLIFDVGMHNGDDTAFYLAKGFSVVAVEANPLLAQEGERRFRKEITSGKLTILNIGIGDKIGTFPFYVNGQHSEWSSFDKEIGSRVSLKETIDVPMNTLEQTLKTFGVPYYLKLDIEGYEFIALRQLAALSVKPKFVSIENGFPEMVAFLSSLNYTKFKFINQATVMELECPTPAREGREVQWKFSFGSSGPFGEDTPGEWKAEQEILPVIESYWGNPERDANVHGWYDLHAKLS